MRVFLVLFLSLPLAVGAEECPYDQGAFKQMYLDLQSEYPQARHVEDKRALEIVRDDSRVVVRYYGCEHYGTEIRYVDNRAASYSEARVFAKAAELIARFGQGRVDVDTLNGLLQGGKFRKIDDHTFLVDYPGMEDFVISSGASAEGTAIEIQFYN